MGRRQLTAAALATAATTPGSQGGTAMIFGTRRPLVDILPELKKPTQLAGAMTIVGAVVIGWLTRLEPTHQIVFGVSGVILLVFGEIFACIPHVSAKIRGLVAVVVFVAFCAFVVAELILYIFMADHIGASVMDDFRL
jgi:hypothetical protein